MNRVEGKVAVVTGGAQRAGRAICEMLASEGAAVAVTDVQAGSGEEVAEIIRSAGGKAQFWTLDVSHEDDVKRVMNEVVRTFGRIDILINSASIGGTDSSTDEATEQDWDAVMAVNVKGVFLCTKHAVPHMRHTGGGSIVNIGSILGKVGSPHAAPFHASKGALRIMTKTDATAYAGDNIRVNSVLPGYIWADTAGAGTHVEGVWLEVAHEEMARQHPLGTLGDAKDVAYAVVYLASDEAKFVTGAELVIDGGYSAR
jgi:NAD(P)-dependent dehydrogenase (short-subunit alcohol dehydrogenase family)